jgi:hypothetical protein
LGNTQVAMSYKLTIAQKPTYLHAIVTGQNTKDNVAAYIEEVRNECAGRNYRRILIEERLEGPRLRTLDVFSIVSEASNRPQRVFNAIAYVDVNAEGSVMKFAESVAVNRGVSVQAFSSVIEAEEWLSGLGDAA